MPFQWFCATIIDYKMTILAPEAIAHPPSDPEVLSADSEEGKKILELVRDAPRLNPHDQEGSNGRGQLSDEEFLGRKLFVRTHFLRNQPVDVVVKCPRPDEPISIPLDLVVDSEGFTSWQGRGANVKKTVSTDEGYLEDLSFNIIRGYATRTSPAPALKTMEMYVQPNGVIFFSNISDGSHRIGAAILRGDQSIPTYNLRVRYLQEDFIQQ